jgi:putative sigma-54 modulation protein
VEITVRGKHFDVPDDVEERARRKLARLEHYLPALADGAAEVDVAHESAKDPQQRFLVHVTVRARGYLLHAHERAAQLDIAVDQAVEVLGRQARRQKDRRYGHSRSRRAREPQLEPAGTPEDADSLEGLDRVASVQRLPAKPMTTEEAVEQMAVLREEFFLFHDVDVEQFALLYKRKDGSLALVIPELP